ncbi:MAG: PD-(D/E)XK nuclease family protein [Flaviflexus sp.]|nr:PD-(D/E)XK nuclease family protein [Flaviflexus sp.]
MIIEFGYFLDGVPWSDRPALGTLRVGPQGLLDVLNTRVARSYEPAPTATRIAAYLTALREAIEAGWEAAAWYEPSLNSDPWGTAERLLFLRDSAVRSGWDCREAGRPGSKPVPVRLAALAAAEAHFDKAAYPGAADALVLLEWELRESPAGNLGIDRIEVREDTSQLPDLWPTIFDHLRARGIPVERVTEPAGAGSLTIVSCADEGDAAIQAARLIAALDEKAGDRAGARAGDTPGEPAGEDAPTMVATRPTQLLDEALADRGLPALGVAGPEAGQPRLNVLGLLLRLTDSTPVDVYLLDELLWSSQVAGRPLLPKRVRSRLHRALAEEPSVLAEEPNGTRTAWGKALDDLAEDGGEHAVAAAQVLELLDIAEGGESVEARARMVAQWLADRVVDVRTWASERNLPGPERESIEAQCEQILTQIRVFVAALNIIGSPDAAMARRLAFSFAAAPLTPVCEVGAPRVVTDPGSLSGSGPVVWWGAADPGVEVRDLWEDDEESYLAERGARIIPASARIKWETEQRLAALSGHPVTAFVPRKIAGEPASAHPLLAYLAKKEGESVSAGLKAATVDSEELAGSQWRLGEAAIPLIEVGLRRPVYPEELERPRIDDGTPESLEDIYPWYIFSDTEILDAQEERMKTRAEKAGITVPTEDRWSRITQLPAGLEPPTRLTSHGTALIPSRLSYSQLEKFLGCTMCWVLEYPLRLRSVGLDDIPAGNRMVGTAVHAIIERIIASGEIPRTAAEVGDAIDAHFLTCISRYASPLQRGGSSLLLEDVRQRVRDSLTAFFVELARAGITITGAEQKFTKTLSLPSKRWKGRELDYTGYRDVDAEIDGRPIVIDVKWSNSTSWHRKLITEGEAIQLAGYSWSREVDGQPPLTGYFLAKHGIFVSADPELPGSPATPGRTAEDLWDEVIWSLEQRLDLLAVGIVPATPGQIRRLVTEAGLDTKPLLQPDFGILNLSVKNPCTYNVTRHLCGAEGTL